MGDTGSVRAVEKESDFIRTSMFQYLLSRLKQLHKRDGIKRWVTLDQQFRMHPLLGKFVSDHFYRIHSPEEAFGSPLSAEYFVHGLPGIAEVPAVWMDVPASAGEEQRKGTSRCRPCEARSIAEQLNRWIDSAEGRKLTFGVISFYKAQELAVCEELSNFGHTTREPDGSWGIAERPVEDGVSPKERLRIGTVDAFQGMEFDVVFLSMVRSSRKLPGPSRDPGELAKQERRHFGHLTSPNRLCVSMSRQKRLLVLVGDKAMIEHELAHQAVPALIGFLNLCKTQGAVVRAGE